MIKNIINSINLCYKYKRDHFVLNFKKKNLNIIKLLLNLNIIKFLKLKKNKKIIYLNTKNSIKYLKIVFIKNTYIKNKNLNKMKNKNLHIISTSKGLILSNNNKNLGGQLISKIII